MILEIRVHHRDCSVSCLSCIRPAGVGAIPPGLSLVVDGGKTAPYAAVRRCGTAQGLHIPSHDFYDSDGQGRFCDGNKQSRVRGVLPGQWSFQQADQPKRRKALRKGAEKAGRGISKNKGKGTAPATLERRATPAFT